LQGYESRLKSAFCKVYGRYNDLVCDHKLPLSHMLDDFFHTNLINSPKKKGLSPSCIALSFDGFGSIFWHFGFLLII
jgi:hypothetical protein